MLQTQCAGKWLSIIFICSSALHFLKIEPDCLSSRSPFKDQGSNGLTDYSSHWLNFLSFSARRKTHPYSFSCFSKRGAHLRTFFACCRWASCSVWLVGRRRPSVRCRRRFGRPRLCHQPRPAAGQLWGKLGLGGFWRFVRWRKRTEHQGAQQQRFSQQQVSSGKIFLFQIKLLWMIRVIRPNFILSYILSFNSQWYKSYSYI